MSSRAVESICAVQASQDRHPRPGDIIIGRGDGSPPAHVLRVLPSPCQIACPTYEDAVTRAIRVAEKAGLDVWLAHHDDRFIPIARHRTKVPDAAGTIGRTT